MEENAQVLELLKQIEKNTRQQTKMSRLQCAVTVAAALCCAVMLVMVWNGLPELTGIVGQMETVLGNLENVTTQLAAADLAEMAENVDALVVTGQKSLEQTMEKINAIDLETLNKAIEDLAKIIEPLARFFGAFN